MEFLDFLDVEANFENNEIPRPRRIRDRINPLTFFDDDDFRYRFRLSKQIILSLCEDLSLELEYHSKRNNCLPPILQICGSLRVLAAGSFQTVIADTIHVHQSTVSRIIDRFLNALLKNRKFYILFPENLAAVKQSFFEIDNFPGVVGAVDGTHISIKKPQNDINPERFRNRKNGISLNVQIVAGPNLEIFNCTARWPGSTHDSRVFNNSLLKDRFEDGNLENCGYLLGDKGYPCYKYLLTPVRHPTTESERRYNHAHCRTRCVVERTIGVLKKRFPCLTNRLNYTPQKSANITIACVILHNFVVRAGDPDFGAIPQDDMDIDWLIEADNMNGHAMRRALIRTHFS